jgi:hypothetical protein
MSFPEQEDQHLQERTEKLVKSMSDFDQWVVRYQSQRQGTRHELPRGLPSQILELRRRADHLRVAASVPVAAAIYGASQSGKSLLVGRLLGNPNRNRRTLGLSENDGTPESLDFAADLNPQLGIEATAVVTRFSLASRCGTSPEMKEAPVRARLLSTADILKALGRGFLTECRSEVIWNEEQVSKLIETELAPTGRGSIADLEWRTDIIEAYKYLKEDLLNYRLTCDLVALDQMLLHHPLSGEGYIQLACRLFWEDWPSISALFRELLETRKTRLGGVDCIYVPWRAVHFILDTEQAEEYQSPSFGGTLNWANVRLVKTKGALALTYDGQGTRIALKSLQGVVAELQIPLLAARLENIAQKLFGKGDCLDIPGARALGSGRGAWTRQDGEKSPDEIALRIHKRGKVGFLFDKYSEELQAGVIVYLQKKGNLEAAAALRPQLEWWGKHRFPEQWPNTLPSVEQQSPSLFVCLTELDRLMQVRPDSEVFEAFVGKEIGVNFSNWFNNYGGEAVPFQNCYLIRYPGTMDNEKPEQSGIDLDGWRRTFLGSKAVQKHVHLPQEKWEAAFRSEDGGVVGLIEAVVQRLENGSRREMLAEKVRNLSGALDAVLTGLYVDPSLEKAAAERRAVADAVTNWLKDDRDGRRTRAMLDALHCDASIIGAAVETVRGTDQEHVLPLDFVQVIRLALRDWLSSREWESLTQVGKRPGGTGVDEQTLNKFGFFLVEYLLAKNENSDADCTARMAEALDKVNDSLIENVRRIGFRRYSELIFDDYLVTPGPRIEMRDRPIDHSHRPHTNLADRWERILADLLASAVTRGVVGSLVPAGNDEVRAIMDGVSELMRTVRGASPPDSRTAN